MKLRYFYIFAVVLIAASTASAQRSRGGRYDIPEAKQKKPTATHASVKSRIIPTMPKRAKKSGYCCIMFDVGVNGEPTSVTVPYCSNPVFKKSSMTSAQGWLFNPAVRFGIPRAVKDQSYLISFRLTDGRKRIIPDANGKIMVNGKANFSRKRLCGLTDQERQAAADAAAKAAVDAEADVPELVAETEENPEAKITDQDGSEGAAPDQALPEVSEVGTPQ